MEQFIALVGLLVTVLAAIHAARDVLRGDEDAGA